MNDYTDIIAEELARSTRRIEAVIAKPVADARNILGVYGVAVGPHFISWMQQAYDSSQSPVAREVIRENIFDEVTEDHPAMLRDFLASSGVIITPQHYEQAAGPVASLWQLYGQGNGIASVASAATLENTSLVFIPYLEELAQKLGCRDITYTKTHGVADIDHAQELSRALNEEMQYGITPWNTMSNAVDTTTSFLEDILSYQTP